MKHCPAADCPFVKRHRRAAEYRDEAARCSDCDSALVEGAAPAPVRVRKAAPPHPPPWRRAAVTLAVPVLLWTAAQVTLPGVDLDQSPYWGLGFQREIPRSMVGILALGVIPFLSAAVLVELGALVVPGWRELRISGPEGRRKLSRASMILGVVLAALQGFLVVRQIESLGIATDGGLAFRATATATLMAASCGAVALTWLCDRHGLGSGFSIVIAATIGPALWELGNSIFVAMLSQTLSALSVLIVLGTLVVLVVASLMVLDAHRGWLAFLPGRKPERRAALRLPASGLAPIELAATLLMLPVTIAGWTGMGDELATKLATDKRLFVIVELLLILGASLVFTWLFNRGAEPRLRAQIPSAWVRSALYLALLVLGMKLIEYFGFTITLGSMLVAVGTAVGLDLVREWRARRQHADLVAVWPIHRVYVLDATMDALERAGIPAFARGAHHRALLQFFGPYVPITILVPSARADEAGRILRDTRLG